MKNLLAFLAIASLAGLVGCKDGGTSSGEDQQVKATNRLTDQGQQQVGMPAVTKFTERRLLKQIYELRDDEKLVCYAYLEGLDGRLHFLTKCIGYGIPYATQFTLPSVQEAYSTYGVTRKEQAEPNGLYMPSQAEGTWLMVPDAKGSPHPMYCEPRVVVSPLKIATALENPPD